MNILVTGGAGFIGANFIIYWLKNHPQDKIINLDKLTYAGNLENLKSVEKNSHYEFIHGDICNSQLVNSLIKNKQIDIIAHFAAESHVDRSILDPAPFIKTNIEGTYILLETALRNKIKRFHHISCYDEKTRAFTNQGLKKFNEIKKGDMVLSLNPKNNKIEWKPVNKVIIQNYQGKMLQVQTKTTNFLVTPNHRMLVQDKKTKRIFFREASNLKSFSINKLPKFYQWEGDKKLPSLINSLVKKENYKDFFYLLGVFIGDGFLAYQEKSRPNKSGLNKKDYIHLCRNNFGRFTNKGKLGSVKKVIMKSWRIFLEIPKDDKSRKKCEQVLTNLGIKWHAHEGKAGTHLYFTSKEYFKIFSQCQKGAKNKEIPFWALNYSKEYLYELFLGLLDSDGSRRKVFFTSSEKLASQFMELCIKLNLNPSLKKRETVSYIGKREIRGLSYIISFGQQWRDVRKNNIKEVFYKGKIWCLTVKDNKNFLIEREGKTLFCGNTDEVFGALPLNTKEKFNEKTPYNPRSPYSASKAASDHLVRAYYTTYNLPITISNCSNNYGPYQFPEKLIPLAITNILEGKKVPIYGDGLYVRDWLYVEDHCRAIDLILHQGKIGETYFIGGLTEDVSNLEVIKKILRIMGKDEDYIEFVKDRPGHDRRYAIDWSKINKELGWKPKVDLDTGLKFTVDWYLKNQDWWKRIKSGEYQKYYEKQYLKR